MYTYLQKATLEEIRHAAARICRDYLTGPWKVVTPEQLIVKRISGGLSNFLYYVSLPDLDEFDEQQLLELDQGNINDKGVSDVIVPPVGYTKNSPGENCREIYGNNEKQAKATTLVVGGTELAPSHRPTRRDSDDDDDSMCLANVKQTLKRQRVDSGSSDSSSMKRMLSLKQEPREILLRIYGQTHGEHALELMITESVVFALLSERNIGPKLHGIFPGGRIEQYIPARALTTVELSDSRTSMKIAEKMGEIHSLNIPMSKEPDWMWNCMDRWLKTLDSIVDEKLESKPNSTVLQKQRELMRTLDYVKEIAWLRSVIESGDYPVVFCHNDLQEGNILLRQTSASKDSRRSRESINSLQSNFDEALCDSLDGNGNAHTPAIKSVGRRSPLPNLDITDDSALDDSFTADNDPDLIIIDFEYCAYNYRGFDLANHFIEWTFDYTNPEFPYFYHYKNQSATAQQQRDFIVAYLKQVNDDNTYQPDNEELSRVEAEVKLFTMFSHLFWSLWAVVNVTSAIEFGYWEYGVARILEYQQLKAAYLKK